jgi:lactate racemase
MLREEILKLVDFSNCISIKPSEKTSINDKDIQAKLQGFPKIEENSLIIVNDQYRSTPSSRIIKALRKIGKIKCPVTFIIATGSHQPPTEDEAIQLTNAGKHDKIIYHDVKNLKNPSYAGVTSRNTEVYYNPAIKGYSKIITIGSVEPHYFAGFTGGAKSLMPGISTKETIRQNHRWAMTSETKLMKTKGNPAFEDIWESANLIIPLEEVLTIQVVNHGDTILHISTGKLVEAFEDAKAVSSKLLGEKFDMKFDRIISFVQPPLDRNLYQSQKATENTRNVLKDGGTIVLVSQCSDGKETSAFFKKLEMIGSYKNILNTLSFEKYELGDHKAFKLAKIAESVEMLYVGGLAEDIVSTAYMKKISIGDFVDLFKKWKSDGDNILIDEAGGFTAYYYDDSTEK